MNYLDQNLRNEQLRPLAKKLTKELCHREDEEPMATLLANIATYDPLTYSIIEYPRNRYAPFRREDILVKLRLLVDNHLLRKIGGETSRVVGVTCALQEKLSKVTTLNTVREPIILRRGKTGDPEDWSRDIEYSDSDETERMRDELCMYNDYMARQEITDTSCIRYQTTLRRIFNNSSFDCGGRFYGGRGSYQALAGHDGRDRTHRRELRINGNKTVELDYSGMHFSILALSEGLPIPEDPYRIEGFDREKVKGAFNTAINATTEFAAIGAIAENITENEEQAEDLLAATKQHMGRLSKYLCSGEGVRLQRIDSNIAANVMRDCILSDVPCLVVHDSFRVESSREQFLKALMVKHFQRELLTTYEPRIK